MHPTRYAIAALMLCLAPHPGAAEPAITKTYSYFTIGGLTGADLESELSSHGPILTSTGVRHPGATRIRLGGKVEYKNFANGECPDCSGSQSRQPSILARLKNWILRPITGSGSRETRCFVTDASVSLETHLALPRWKNRNKADRDTVLVWDTLSSDIKRHEERHAEIARQYARTLEKALEALHPERTCEKMEERVNATSQMIIEKHAADQQRFDRAEAASFERRMTRMLRFKAEKLRNGG